MVYRQTDRERQRYVTYEGEDPIPTFRTLYGALGEAEAGLQRHGAGVIRTTSANVHRVRAAIALTRGCKTLRVGTSIRDAKTLAGVPLQTKQKTITKIELGTKSKLEMKERGNNR